GTIHCDCSHFRLVRHYSERPVPQPGREGEGERGSLYRLSSEEARMVTHTAAQHATLRPLIVFGLVVLTLGCAAPSLDEGTRALPSAPWPGLGPQGVVNVYSERYVYFEKTTPVFRRRPVELLTTSGHFLHRYENPVGDGLIRLEVPMGTYLVASEVHWVQRAVQVEVQPGPPVEISEAELTQAPPLSEILAGEQLAPRITEPGD